MDRDYFENNWQLPSSFFSSLYLFFLCWPSCTAFHILKVIAENKSRCFSSNPVVRLPVQAERTKFNLELSSRDEDVFQKWSLDMEAWKNLLIKIPFWIKLHVKNEDLQFCWSLWWRQVCYDSVFVKTWLAFFWGSWELPQIIIFWNLCLANPEELSLRMPLCHYMHPGRVSRDSVMETSVLTLAF